MKIIIKKLSDLKPASYNPRYIEDDALQGLTASMEEFGCLQPIIWNKKTGNIVGGHQRYKVLLSQKAEETEVVVVDLPLAKEKALNLTLNNQNITGDFTAGLESVLKDIKEVDLDLYNTLSLDRLLADIPEIPEPDGGGNTDPDALPKVEKEPVIKTGDLVKLGKHRILCGDSTKKEDVDKLMVGVKADMVFTDPPYGVDYDGGTTKREKLKGDENTDLYSPCCENAYKYSDSKSSLYLWHAGVKGIKAAAAAAAAGWEIRAEIIWNKNLAQFGSLSAQYKQKHEPCYYCFKKGKTVNWNGPTNEVTVWDVDRSSRNEFHPTQKPVALAERAIKNHSAKIILDFFLGSGSTLIACETTNRICRGLEISPQYVQVCVERWVDFTGRPEDVTIERDGKEFGWEEIKTPQN